MVNYVVVDCDMGNDDAWALLMLIKAEEKFSNDLKILGVSCVHGNTDVNNAAKNTLRLLDAADRKDIAVFKGCSKAIVPPAWERTNFFHGKDGFGDLQHSNEVDLNLIQTKHAVTAFYEFATQYPKMVDFIMLGPLTNLAICISMYDDFLDKIRNIFLMGGNIRGKGNSTKCAEFNFLLDPEAARIVLENEKVHLCILPWETCVDGDFDMTLNWRLDVLGSLKDKVMKLMNYVEEAILRPKGFDYWIVCDAMLVAAYLFPSKIISKSRRYHATIELNGTHTRGQMVLDHLKNNVENVTIIEAIDESNYRKVILWTAGLDVPGFYEWKCFN